jgi:glyoxylase-like metal-dependent hydrolase (beta-lactamase superfamily II)
MTPTPPWLRQPHGITTVDAHYTRPGYASVHVIERRGEVALVDTGTNASVPHVLAALTSLGIARSQVKMLFITHVHLDHAGGAGALMEQLPNARAVAHPRAAPHLIDPSRLIAASRDVYGSDRFDHLYGALIGIEAERVVTTADGETLRLGESELLVLHTPGHALHHHVLYDRDASSVFTGDTFGLSYRQLDGADGPIVLPTTTPSQFDPNQLLASIDRIVALAPESAYLTHYGRVDGVVRLGAQLEDEIEKLVQIARSEAGSAERERRIAAAVREHWLELLSEHRCPLGPGEILDLLENDIELNAAGLSIWLDRAARAPG